MTDEMTTFERPETPDLAAIIAPEVNLGARAVAAVIELLDDGCTVPFIARYRKEATGGAEDVAVTETMERLRFHREFFDRKVTILETIHGQGKLTPELRSAVEHAKTRTELEDLYLPYRPKRRTRATVAKEKGLGPLADRIWKQEDQTGDPFEIAADFVAADRGVGSADEALQGACDIVAERVVETAAWRGEIRELTWRKGFVYAHAARGKAETKSKFTDYYDFSEPVSRIPSHRFLAILRGEKEGFVSQKIMPDPETAKTILCERVLRGRKSIWTEFARRAVEDGYDRLLSQQIATEIRGDLKLNADREAIDVFASNLRELLMAPPFGARAVMAIDPGYRTGCKVVVLDATGRLL
ncbi:MAG: Tex-like N-terminal domain-containing protein, partial [bacterium]